MTEIKLYNTKVRAKVPFEPIDAKNVRMYVCGPTVYDRAHLGNARPVVVFDVLYRLLRHVYGADHVNYVRNFTDVDDKINARAAESGRSITDITNETIQWFLDDMGALGALEPNHAPRATAYIPEMIAMIEELIDKDFAYPESSLRGHNSDKKYVLLKESTLNEHAMFDVRHYKPYGELSGANLDEMIAGARVEVADNKRDPLDFILWKPSRIGEPGWDSPWGKGRPGWHIECSAMSRKLLGEKFDIHGGGLDLQFPHHENEIAQSCACGGKDSFAQYWMHNEMLQVEGRKMSKSLGNFFTVHDLLEGHDGQPPIPGEVIRFVLLSTHYRKPMDWTERKREKAEKTLRKIAGFLGGDPLQKPWPSWRPMPPPQEFIDALSNDLNTSLALTLVNKYLKNEQESELRASLQLLGFEPELLVQTFREFHLNARKTDITSGVHLETRDAELAVDTEGMIEMGRRFLKIRQEALKSKDFSKVDAFKVALTQAGLEVRMSKDGVELIPTVDFDLAKLEALK